MSVLKFEPLSDAEIAGGGARFNDAPDRNEMIYQYRLLRDHHIAETAALAAKDRALLAQMAATLAAPAMMVPTADAMATARLTAVGTVYIARLILAEVDKK